MAKVSNCKAVIFVVVVKKMVGFLKNALFIMPRHDVSLLAKLAMLPALK